MCVHTPYLSPLHPRSTATTLTTTAAYNSVSIFNIHKAKMARFEFPDNSLAYVVNGRLPYCRLGYFCKTRGQVTSIINKYACEIFFPDL